MIKNCSAKITNLKAKITQLQVEKQSFVGDQKTQLRLFLHEIIEAYYRTVNGSTSTKKDQEKPEEENE